MLSHSFFIITLVGNLIIIGFSLVFFQIEYATNDSVHSLLDAIWWGFATATTVGYGDIIPSTQMGKILGIMLMLTGTALFATYTALFARTILEDDFLRYKNEDNELEDDFLTELKKHRDSINKKIKQYEQQTHKPM